MGSLSQGVYTIMPTKEQIWIILIVYILSREIVRGMLAAVDPKGVELRKKHRLVRRNYTAKVNM